MIIDNLTSTYVFVEKRGLSKIIGDTTTNKEGMLEVDANENNLISPIDSGDTHLYRLAMYEGGDGLMLYNSTTKNIQIAKQGDMLNVGIDFGRGTKYFLGSKLLKSTSHINNVFDVLLDGLNIFKIFLDGRELKSHSANGNKITINGNDRLLIDEFSELVVYAYRTTVISKATDNFEIEYFQYDRIWDKEAILDGSYLENIRGIPVDCFDSTAINQSVTKTIYRGGFKFSKDTRINSVDNATDFNVFSVSNLVDFIQYVGNEEFRMLFVNHNFGRVILLNNCRASNGVSLILEKAKNTKKFTLDSGNYIDIITGDSSAYGMERYGRKQYGTGVWVHNSHRRGE